MAKPWTAKSGQILYPQDLTAPVRFGDLDLQHHQQERAGSSGSSNDSSRGCACTAALACGSVVDALCGGVGGVGNC